MKSFKFIFLLFSVIIFSNCEKTKNSNTTDKGISPQAGEFYQLKTYTFDSQKQEEATDKFLSEAYLPGLKKMGIKNIGIFKPRQNEADSVRKIYVLFPFSSMAAFLDLHEKLEKDESYLAAGSDYLQAPHDQPPYQRMESTILRAFVDMPSMKTPDLNGPRSERIYELRSYESATERLFKNKVDMFNAGGEVKLFDRLGFNAVFYGEVISGSKMPNLMYLTTFSDQASRDAHWEAFGNAPEWKELLAMPKYKDNVSHIDIFFLYPTEYSDY